MVGNNLDKAGAMAGCSGRRGMIGDGSDDRELAIWQDTMKGRTKLTTWNELWQDWLTEVRRGNSSHGTHGPWQDGCRVEKMDERRV